MSQYPPPSQPPGGGGQWTPPPPPPPSQYPQYPQYEPFQDYYRQQGAPPPQRRRTQGGILGGILAALAAIWAYGKYVLVLAFKFPIVKTMITLAISLGLYAAFYGPWFAVALVLMILVHEMGHVVEIRRQGMQATAPLFIPFMGAAIFQRSHPTDAYHQALIGIAGPIAGTVGATVAFVLFGATGWGVFLLMALIGFYINLFNLLPIAPLDGGWVLAPLSKWVFVAGFALLAVALLALHVFLGPILFLVLLFGIPAVIERFRNDRSAYYQAVTPQAKLALGVGWLLLVAYLGIASYQVHGLLDQLVR
jgi:Zn-dependent protease